MAKKNKLKTTLLFTLVLSLMTIALAITVQLKGESSVKIDCSYLDPITIDILAFIAGLFLIIEGFFRIYEHPNASLKSQFTRCIRVAGGCALLTLHILQFVHK